MKRDNLEFEKNIQNFENQGKFQMRVEQDN